MTRLISTCASLEDTLRLIPGYDPFETAPDGYWLDVEAAERAIGFFSDALLFFEGERAGTPFDLEPWQQAIVGNLFGWKDTEGFRRYRECLIYVPRKCGKTPLAAGIAVYCGLCEGEPGGQIYSAAAEREQAGLIFRHAVGMIEQRAELAARCRIYRATKAIEFPRNTIYRALSADAHTKHGYNASTVIIDELHVHPNRELVDVLITATASRRQPLIVHTTTADYDRPSVCNEKYDYACRVRDGVFADSAFLPVIYEASNDDDWTDPDVWARANPNLGVSLKLEYMQRECARAKEVPAYENEFKRLHLNIRTEQDVRWLPVSAWDACDGDPFDPKLFGKPIVGLDLSSTTDISAMLLVWRHNGEYYLRSRFWLPEETVARADHYREWADAGFIGVTPGNVVDYGFIRAEASRLADEFGGFREIAADPWNATHLLTELVEDGHAVLEIRQQFKNLSPAMKELERAVLRKIVHHESNPVMRWMFSNIAVKMDHTGSIMPDKSKAKAKIDGIAALLDALSRWVVTPATPNTISEGLILL